MIAEWWWWEYLVVRWQTCELEQRSYYQVFHFTYVFVIIKSRGKVHCRTGDEGTEGSRGIAVLFL
jgi:hypothetical protein